VPLVTSQLQQRAKNEDTIEGDAGIANGGKSDASTAGGAQVREKGDGSIGADKPDDRLRSHERYRGWQARGR